MKHDVKTDFQYNAETDFHGEKHKTAWNIFVCDFQLGSIGVGLSSA